MNPVFEQRYLQVEQTQWWCKARRQLVRRLVKQLVPDRSSPILEIGCSGGVLVEQLLSEGYTDVHGVDISESAIAAARRRGLQNMAIMDAARLSFPDKSFSALIASDVLEHIEDPFQALTDWRRVLARNGRLIVFVPAFQALWSSHDEANQHFRRYSGSELRRELEQAGFVVERLSYWNMVLTLPGVLLKLAERLSRRSARARDTGGLVQPTAPVNTLLYRLIAAENALCSYADLPFGTSVFAIARA